MHAKDLRSGEVQKQSDELEEALAGWLRGQITRIEQRLARSADPLLEQRVEFSKLAET
jgi:hypothetical protein